MTGPCLLASQPDQLLLLWECLSVGPVARGEQHHFCSTSCQAGAQHVCCCITGNQAAAELLAPSLLPKTTLVKFWRWGDDGRGLHATLPEGRVHANPVSHTYSFLIAVAMDTWGLYVDALAFLSLCSSSTSLFQRKCAPSHHQLFCWLPPNRRCEPARPTSGFRHSTTFVPGLRASSRLEPL